AFSSFSTVTTSPTSSPTSTRSSSSSTKTNPTDIITTYPASCTTRPTQTIYASSGCAHSCDTGFCVIDAAATVSCGCPTVFISPTTVTMCATASPCRQCYTGWGTFIYTQPCMTSAKSSTPTGLPSASP
ncbi:hypothetical protein C8A05DRAFT_15104, partial [Staphylotrichum tortipilum]